MKKSRIVSQFKQARSINTKEKIIDAATRYFCENGFYTASIRKLAQAANISIGSFYFYFKDKDELFLEVMRMQNDRFISGATEAFHMTEIYHEDKKKWLRAFFVNLLNAHENLGKMRNELKALYYENPRIACLKDEQEQAARKLISDLCNKLFKDDLKVNNPEIAILILSDLTDAALDRITYGDNSVNKEEILDECIEAMYKYLFL